MRALFLSLIALIILNSSLSLIVVSAAERPNIVILYADDMGYGDLAIQNKHSKIPTPHLDQLAREGMRFTDAHSSSGICSPSRYALLTGRYHWRKFHQIVNSFGPSVFAPEELTLPELLREQGYRTACIGKWHLGWDWDAIRQKNAKKGAVAPETFDWSKSIPDGPTAHGFDYYFGDDVPNFPPYTWIENDKVTIEPTLPLTSTPKTAEGSWEARPGPMAPDWKLDAVMPTLTKKAVDWIGQQQGSEKPFFLYFPFTSPHAPIVPTEEFIGKSKAGGYGDFVVQTDDTIGQVLAALKGNGFADNTLVIFSADNGPEKYAYERIRNFDHRSAGPLRGLKRDIWEGGHRVPMIVRWPGHVTADKVSDALTSQVDIYATIAAIVGPQVPEQAADDSYNQLPVWLNQGSAPRDTVVHNTNANGFALRHNNWVFIAAKTGAVSAVPAWFDEANGYKKNSQPGELYDLSGDVAQKNNLYADQPDKVAELTKLLKQVQQRGQVRRGYSQEAKPAPAVEK